MVASSRRATTALVTLVVYVAGLVGGGMHHHHAEYARDAAAGAAGQPAGHPGAWAVSGGEDEDGCALCAAIHLAKAAPPAAPATTNPTPAAGVVTSDAQP